MIGMSFEISLYGRDALMALLFLVLGIFFAWRWLR